VHIATLAMLSFLLFACAASPPPSDERVQILTAAQKSGQCKTLGTFTIAQRGGPDKPTAAMMKAISEVSRRGGNGIHVISSSEDWEYGAVVEAEALQCLF